MGRNAEKVFEEADEETEELYEFIRDAAEWFHINEGEMFTREEARETLMDELNISSELANRLIGELVEDEVDPVVQVNTGEKSFVGVAEYEEFELAYGYIDYDDVTGKQKKVVCARCVETADHDSEVAHAVSQNTDSEYEPLLSQIKNHFSNMHDTQPSGVKTGATLAAGTTIGGSRVATRNWATGGNISHSDLSSISSNDHHSKYTDGNARGAVEGSTLNSLTLNRSGLNAGESWLEINGGSNGILANYTDNNEFRHYGNVTMYSGADIYMGDNDVNNARRVNFNNSEHSDLNNRAMGWDDSEGGGDVAGGFIFQDTNGNNRYFVSSSTRDYNIEKNGNDKNGVINFIT